MVRLGRNVGLVGPNSYELPLDVVPFRPEESYATFHLLLRTRVFFAPTAEIPAIRRKRDPMRSRMHDDQDMVRRLLPELYPAQIEWEKCGLRLSE